MLNVDGTSTITLNGREFTLRPGFRALARVERALGLHTGALAQRILTGSLAMFELATIAQALMADGQKWTTKDPLPALDDVGEWIIGSGLYPELFKSITESYCSSVKSATKTAEEATAGNGDQPAQE